MANPSFSGLPDPQGLYHPQDEHDACGIGFVAHSQGVASHDIVAKGVRILENLAHRGACGCDAETGDGAGLLIQIPHAFFARECGALGFPLPAQGEYAVGMMFLPVEPHARLQAEGLLEEVLSELGLAALGWRDTPVDQNAVGRLARATQPYIEQLFVDRPREMDADVFERRLYLARKVMQSRMRESEIEQKEMFYIPSFSSRTIVYKGLLLAGQLPQFYGELQDPLIVSALCLVHQRFSTNTFPSWKLAHPFRFIAHNGEINTVRGNVNWMAARERVLQSELFGEDLEKLLPIVEPEGSDSACFDNAFELLVMAGRSLAHSMAMLVPEAWSGDPHMDPDRRAFYEYHCSLMEPWDGPAAVAFTDGRAIGATLDRNGLRPARYLVTHDDLVVMASESGCLSIPPSQVKRKGRLRPGRMLLVDTVEKRIVEDEEIKAHLAQRKPYRQWLAKHQITLEKLPEPPRVRPREEEDLTRLQRVFGYTEEDLRRILAPMAAAGTEPIGSMGSDTPPACLSDRPQSLFHYFKQLFAQVTNPPIDPLREELVMSLISYIGNERNILDETPEHCHTLKLEHPILENRDLEKLRRVSSGDLLATTIHAQFMPKLGAESLRRALNNLTRRASLAVEAGYTLIVLSDRGTDEEMAPIPSLLALAAVHNRLTREGTRTQVALVVESGEPREVEHFALLIGYGASAVNPYLAFDTIDALVEQGDLPPEIDGGTARKRFIKAINKGLLKVFSKMGISTLQSYRGAQVFEAIGLDQDFVAEFFTGTRSRLGGVGLDVIAEEARMKHEFGFRSQTESSLVLEPGGEYAFRVGGERHLFDPISISRLQHAVRQESYETFEHYAKAIDEQQTELKTFRGLLQFKTSPNPIPLEAVEPASEIVKRFATGAMSFGSISKEAHETLAVAMNRIGARSNTGEGGEDPERFEPDENGDLRRSSIKQVASGRFGVTTNYLVNADELQIKMAQGAKPGEGGQLPGAKVDEVVARVRYAIPGVGLISPPPHHDIYSIEDLSQLIFDLKNVNPKARISVKLVSEVGVGTVAAGVAKAHADVVLISGDSGGTGASPLSSMRHAGAPWELGLAETQQTLVLNDLRGRVVVQTDGKLQNGRDVVIAALLGAEEFGFATAPLISLGCLMMRKCHLNTCPVGIATRDPVLRAKFTGKPEHVINFFFFVAEQARRIMASLGVRRFEDLVGRVDLLEAREAIDHWKARGLDLAPLLHRPQMPSRVARRKRVEQDHGLEKSLDFRLLDVAQDAIATATPIEIKMPIRNVHRTVGAMLSGEVARRYGEAGLPENTLVFRFTGTAGQSFGAFLAPGVFLELEGDANDYVGKGLSGGTIVAYPPKDSTFRAEQSVILGNVALYGATSGSAFFSGVAGERFAVRNSGATAVVEGLGDHGCEYMTRGLVVVLGETGRNFAAGMSGGLAFVHDATGDFAATKVNHETVDLESPDPEDLILLHQLLEKHRDLTKSQLAESMLADWENAQRAFVKVFPREYKRVLGIPAQPRGDERPLEVARG